METLKFERPTMYPPASAEYYALRLCGKSHWCGNPELADK